jgi:hypothetical protein
VQESSDEDRLSFAEPVQSSILTRAGHNYTGAAVVPAQVGHRAIGAVVTFGGRYRTTNGQIQLKTATPVGTVLTEDQTKAAGTAVVAKLVATGGTGASGFVMMPGLTAAQIRKVVVTPRKDNDATFQAEVLSGGHWRPISGGLTVAKANGKASATVTSASFVGGDTPGS